jgi:hypothetical protein
MAKQKESCGSLQRVSTSNQQIIDQLMSLRNLSEAGKRITQRAGGTVPGIHSGLGITPLPITQVGKPHNSLLMRRVESAWKCSCLCWA